jgi:SagB-type dehydrogenase family enzyme
MPKLLWVLLPLLLVAALLALRLMRGRAASRHALNIAFSLVLLAYVATTAGLGIFWVANQQLPVFDWHYLFGYATVLLLLLHLWFNWHVVWRFLVRPRAVTLPPAGTAAAAVQRRGALGLAGALLASATAYWLGLRQGRNAATAPALALSEPGDVQGASASFALVERYHTMSSNSRTGVLLRAPGVDWGDAPPPFKRYATAVRVALPPPGTPPGMPFDVAALAALLWHTAGVTSSRTAIMLRASPSSGALFATEVYVATHSVVGLAPGLWHYDALTHALQQIEADAVSPAQLGAPQDGALRDAAALVVATAVFRRSGHKYKDRTYRYVLADLGHALENLRVAALAAAVQPRFAMRFDETRCAATLRLDQAEEGVLALLALEPLQSAPAEQQAAEAARAGPQPATWPAPGRHAPAATPEPRTPLGVTGTMHAASSWRATLLHQPLPAPQRRVPLPEATLAQAVPLPAAAAANKDVFKLIAARRSLRRFSTLALPLEALSGLLAAMAATPMLLPAQTLHLDLVVNAVAGLPPGAYRYDPARHALLFRRPGIDLRKAARAAALDQDVIGDAAVVFVLAIDRDALREDTLGPARAYRHALLHAGCIGERIYLEAGARGLGACAVGAFFDDEAAALVAADPAREWIVHLAALGVPA